MMIPVVFASLIRLVLGILYPSYASFKALRSKTVTNLYKWMMYWILFALLSAIEAISDVLLGFWMPLYVEMKIVMQIWLILPISQRSLGSGVIYQRFVHRYLIKHEVQIDHSIAQLQDQGYSSIVLLCKNTFQLLTNILHKIIINAPVYVTEFLQNNKCTLKSQTQDANGPKSNSINDIYKVSSTCAANEEQFDSGRFEELQHDMIINEVKNEFMCSNEGINTNKSNSGSSGVQQGQFSTAEQSTKTRLQPKRKANTKIIKFDESLENFEDDIPDQAVSLTNNHQNVRRL